MGAKCVFASDYKEWKNQRQILAPAFTTKKLKSLKPIVNKAINKLLVKFDAVAKSGQEVDLIDIYRVSLRSSAICIHTFVHRIGNQNSGKKLALEKVICA